MAIPCAEGRRHHHLLSYRHRATECETWWLSVPDDDGHVPHPRASSENEGGRRRVAFAERTIGGQTREPPFDQNTTKRATVPCSLSPSLTSSSSPHHTTSTPSTSSTASPHQPPASTLHHGTPTIRQPTPLSCRHHPRLLRSRRPRNLGSHRERSEYSLAAVPKSSYGLSTLTAPA
jgi:hypothetical protein